MYEPKTDLSKWMQVITQEIGAINPMAFKEIHLENAFKQADDIYRSTIYNMF